MSDQPQFLPVLHGNTVVPLESILCTEELSRCPPRPPDYEKENLALVALARALADSPQTVLQALVDTILDVLDADSAGVSLLTDDEKSFHWPAVAGMWQPHRGGGTPRDFGPCGDVLDRNAPLMFRHFELRYTYFAQVTPPVEEGLLVPFSIKGRTVGTIWAIAHDERRKFDAEDMRQLVSLGNFASAAYQAKMVLDASERRAEALAQSQSDLAQRLDALPAAIYTTDADGRLTYFNPAAVELSGRLPKLGTDRWCVTSKLYQLDGTPVAYDDSAMAITLKTGRAVRGKEVIVERPDGTRRWCTPYPTPLHDSEGRLIGGINMLVDITDRRQAEDALRQSEATFRALADASPGLIWRVDPHGRVTYVNRRYLEYFGKTAQEVFDDGWKCLIHPDDAPGYLAATALSQSTKTPLKSVARVQHNTGSWRWIESHGMPLFGDNGEYAGHVGVSLDITERRQYEELLSEADRHKNEFLAMLGHELRNPLAPMLPAIEIIRRAKRLQVVEVSDHRTAGPGNQALETRVDPNHGIDHALDVLQRQVGQMMRLVDDLLDAARISRGKRELRCEHVELSSVVHQAVEAIGPLERRNHELTVTLPPDPVYLNADAARISQVVGNLLNNACKFTPPGGHIWVTVEREDASDANHAGAAPSTRPASRVAIRVRDTGIGIAADQLANVFNLFTQIDTSLERSVTGLGVGLTLVKTLTEMHGGTVEASSAGIGQGCEFVVRLPISGEAEASASRRSVIRAAVTVPLRILIVDDNDDSAAMLAMLLQFSGHETFTEHDGLAAVRAAAKLQPDVIFLDIGLPLLNGYEAARRIREQQHERRPVLVALTGWGHDEDRRRSEEAGFDAHVVKPLDEPSLERLLARIGKNPQQR